MSRLTKIELINFMSLPHAVLEFDQSGIVSPVGYNDSGKSAITRALAVLWFDEYSQLQSKFITDGQDSFVIRNYFDDDVMIQRVKYSSGANFWQMSQGQKIIYSNQLPNGTFAACRGVPEAIQQYLGVAKDDATGEILNVRRNTDKLFLVKTTGGENYQILNNLCQGERLAYAVSELNTDVNSKNRDLASKSSRLLGKKETLAQMQVFDEKTEAYLLKNAGELQSKSAVLEKLVNLAQFYNNFAGKRVAAPIDTIDLDRLQALARLETLSQHLNDKTIEGIPEIDVSRYEILTKISEIAKVLNQKVCPAAPIVDEARYSALAAIAKLNNIIDSAEQARASLESKYTTMKEELTQIAKDNDWRICPNCGEIVSEGKEIG